MFVAIMLLWYILAGGDAKDNSEGVVVVAIAIPCGIFLAVVLLLLLGNNCILICLNKSYMFFLSMAMVEKTQKEDGRIYT